MPTLEETAAVARVGRQTSRLVHPVAVHQFASVVGSKEREGPLGPAFDRSYDDSALRNPTFEEGEVRLLKEAVMLVLQKAGRSPGDVDRLCAGDLLDQNVTVAFAALGLEIPTYGVYGACSTSAESLALAALAVDGGYVDLAVAATASHHLTSERQYRFPVELGVQRTPTSQWTATGGAAFLVGRGEGEAQITHATAGIVRSKGIKDPNNMGAAMAPAAADTIAAHLRETKRAPDEYDLILTGDLGLVGRRMCLELLGEEHGITVDEERFLDSGLLLYRRKDQDVHAGASGSACSALGLAGFLLPGFAEGKFERVLFVATGSLHSPTTAQQGHVIPCVAHAIAFQRGGTSV